MSRRVVSNIHRDKLREPLLSASRWLVCDALPDGVEEIGSRQLIETLGVTADPIDLTRPQRARAGSNQYGRPASSLQTPTLPIAPAPQ